MNSSTRRGFLQSSLLAPASLLLPGSLLRAQGTTVPISYVTASAQSANSLYADWQTQYIQPANLDWHHTVASNLFGSIAAAGMNQQLAQLASNTLRADPTLITRPGSYISQAAAQTGTPLNTTMLNKLVLPASSDAVLQLIGTDLGAMQSRMLTYLAQASASIWTSQGAAWKSRRILERNQVVQAKLRQYRTEVQYETVGLLGDFAIFATLFVAGGAALLGGIVASPVAAAAGGAIFAIWVVGMGIAAIGSAIGLAGMTYILEEEMDGGPLSGPSPYQGSKFLPNKPCLPNTLCEE